MPMKNYVVYTDVGAYHTAAPSPAKAINNVRFRLFGRRPARTYYWEVKEVERRAS